MTSHCHEVISGTISANTDGREFSQGDMAVAEKADDSLEAIRTGRIDAGDLKRLSPFAG